MAQKEDVPHDFGLLFKPILMELPARLQTIIITAKRVPPERQEYAFLMLPYMHQLMNEKTLQMEVGVAEIVAE